VAREYDRDRVLAQRVTDGPECLGPAYTDGKPFVGPRLPVGDLSNPSSTLGPKIDNLEKCNLLIPLKMDGADPAQSRYVVSRHSILSLTEAHRVYSCNAMFFRVKPSGPCQYLQIVESYCDAGKVRQKVFTTLGRLEQLQERGDLDSLLRSGIKFFEKLAYIDSYEKGNSALLKIRGSVCRRCSGHFGRNWGYSQR
jgi:hypothetical protein